jgi:proteasome lid subunit RPN8/RPN11
MRWQDESPPGTLPVWSGTRPGRITPLPGPACGGRTDPWIGVSRAVLETVLAHVRASRHESGGLLVGTAHALDPQRTDCPGRIQVMQAVAATDGEASRISLRMDSSVWQAAGRALETLQDAEPAARIVGWYHSHPGLGAFFSETDRRTQRSFFAHAYSVGWVIDPLSDEHAAFLGADSDPVALGIVTGSDD